MMATVPDYILSAVFIILNVLPLTINGKQDDIAPMTAEELAMLNF